MRRVGMTLLTALTGAVIVVGLAQHLPESLLVFVIVTALTLHIYIGHPLIAGLTVAGVLAPAAFFVFPWADRQRLRLEGTLAGRRILDALGGLIAFLIYLTAYDYAASLVTSDFRRTTGPFVWAFGAAGCLVGFWARHLVAALAPCVAALLTGLVWIRVGHAVRFSSHAVPFSAYLEGFLRSDGISYGLSIPVALTAWALVRVVVLRQRSRTVQAPGDSPDSAAPQPAGEEPKAAVRKWLRPSRIWPTVLLVLAWTVFTFYAPACVYLPSVSGRPATMRRLVGADSQGRLHWLEAEKDLGFAWGIRWWWRPIPHAFSADFGFEYVPPLRFAKGPWLRWRMVRSDGQVRPFDPPLEPWPGVSWHSQLSSVHPEVLADGSWVIVTHPRIYSLGSEGEQWTSLEWNRRKEPGALGVAETLQADGTIAHLELIHDPQAASDHRQDTYQIVVTDPSSGKDTGVVPIELPGQRPERAPYYDIKLSAITQGFLFLEAHGQDPGAGVCNLFLISAGGRRARQDAQFQCARIERLTFSASEDGQLVNVGDAVYGSTGEKLRSVGPFWSTLWLGHTLIGVRRYPLFAERVLNGKEPMGELLSGLREPASVRGPEAWRGARDQSLYVEIQDAPDAIRKGRWWLGGIDEAGKSDEIERVNFQ